VPDSGGDWAALRSPRRPVPERVAPLIATVEMAPVEALDVAELVVVGLTCSVASVPESRVPAS
jgi:hypothetical protein